MIFSCFTSKQIDNKKFNIQLIFLLIHRIKSHGYFKNQLQTTVFLFILFTTLILIACGGGGGGGGFSQDFSSGVDIPNSGWGGGIGVNSSATNSASLSAEAGTFTTPDDINWESITFTITVTSEGTTTTHTLTNTETEAIANLLTSLKKGDVVKVSAEITMDDDSIRTTDSGAVTIGIGDNRISLPTPYSYTCDVSSSNAYEDRYSATGNTAPTITADFSGGNTGIYTVNNASSRLPTATAPGYKFDHWETVPDGQTYVPGVSRGDVTIKPVFVPDYTCDYGYLGDTVLITKQQEFTDFMEKHYWQDFSGKTIVLDCDVSTGEIFSSNDGSFLGTFDGRGHTVNLTGNNAKTYGSETYAGLFAKNAGTIKSVKVSGSLTTFGNESGYAGGITAINESGGTVMNCANLANISGVARFAGGVVGKNNGTVKQCYNKGTVQGNSSFQPMAGGITGWNYGAISDCYNTGTIDGNSNCNKGGITGNYSAAGDSATISNCYNTFSGSGNFGALCGYAASSIGVSNFYYDTTTLSKSSSGPVSCTDLPLTEARNLATDYPSIWERLPGATLPTLIDNPE